MKHVTQSFWFWLLIIGIFLILLAALLGGGLKDVNGWIWAIFIAGAVLAILGIIFGIVAWAKAEPCDMRNDKSSKMTPVESRSDHLSSPSSPIGTPTRVTSNVPQSQRGFATTNLNLSALSP